MSNYKSKLIAHRGDISRYPENSLSGFKQLLQQGVELIEFDLQMTADGVPVLCHDVCLKRLLGSNQKLNEMKFSALSNYPLIGKTNQEAETIGSLEQFVKLIRYYPKVCFFAEIKVNVRQLFGNAALDKILQILQPVWAQCRIISFSHQALAYIKSQNDMSLGYVLPDWREKTRNKAESLQPDYMIVDFDKLHNKPSELWPGSWHWMVYVVDQAELIKPMEQLGMDYIETNRYVDLLSELNEKLNAD